MVRQPYRNIVVTCWIIVGWVVIVGFFLTTGSSHDFTWRVAPRLIVRGEDAKVATSYKVLIVHWKERRGGRKKLRMEDNLKGDKEIVISHKSGKR